MLKPLCCYDGPLQQLPRNARDCGASVTTTLHAERLVQVNNVGYRRGVPAASSFQPGVTLQGYSALPNATDGTSADGDVIPASHASIRWGEHRQYMVRILGFLKELLILFFGASVHFTLSVPQVCKHEPNCCILQSDQHSSRPTTPLNSDIRLPSSIPSVRPTNRCRACRVCLETSTVLIFGSLLRWYSPRSAEPHWYLSRRETWGSMV